MATHKHLSLSERQQIEKLLLERASFKAIGRTLNRDCTTISKEVRSHIFFVKTGAYGRSFNNCKLRKDCTLTKLCDPPTNRCKHKRCCFCDQCYKHCSYYVKEECLNPKKPPYVCNGCMDRYRCTLEKSLYQAKYAQKEYEAVCSESRSGVAISEEEALVLDKLISPLIRKGHSIHHICASNKDSVMFSEKCLYNYVEAGLFSARNMDLPRKVRYRPRRSRHDSFKVDRACRINRTFGDYLAYREEHPDTPVVQMDTVIGRIGGKVLLTIHFVETQFMLAFLRERNDSQSVIDLFEALYRKLGKEVFCMLVPLCLTDNGSEFTNPGRLEFDPDGNRRTRLFYCDPASPHQRGASENNHSFIRKILPQGTSFDNLTQDQVNRMMNHINSYRRKKLGDLSPFEVFQTFHGEEILVKLGAELVPPQEITLRPSLLR